LPSIRYGGTAVAVHALCRALVDRGVDLEVFTTNLDGAGTNHQPVGTRVVIDGVPVRYFACPALRRLSWAPAMATALHAETQSFDLVHIHSLFLWPTWAAARQARRANIPYVISPRGMLFRSLIERRSWAAKTIWLAMMERDNLADASAVHATSKLEAAALQAEWQFSRLVTIPNGVEVDPDDGDGEVSADIAAATSRGPYVLFFGRISWKKGLELLLKACARAQPVSLIVAGPDDEKRVPGLSRLAAELGIADRVVFLPRTIVGTDRNYLYRRARAFVLPSQSENFGNTVVEAMVRACPVIVTRAVGAAEIVASADAGLIVDATPQAIAAAIDRMTGQPVWAAERGLAGQCLVRSRHGWPMVADQMIKLYQEIKERNAARRHTRDFDLQRSPQHWANA
jgi:glycosyltransferase involved in cell wall biosynthesis